MAELVSHPFTHTDRHSTEALSVMPLLTDSPGPGISHLRSKLANTPFAVSLPVTKILKQLKEGRIYFGSRSEGTQSIMVGMAWRQEREAAAPLHLQSGSRERSTDV